MQNAATQWWMDSNSIRNVKRKCEKLRTVMAAMAAGENRRGFISFFWFLLSHLVFFGVWVWVLFVLLFHWMVCLFFELLASLTRGVKWRGRSLRSLRFLRSLRRRSLRSCLQQLGQIDDIDTFHVIGGCFRPEESAGNSGIGTGMLRNKNFKKMKAAKVSSLPWTETSGRRAPHSINLATLGSDFRHSRAQNRCHFNTTKGNSMNKAILVWWWIIKTRWRGGGRESLSAIIHV